MIIPDDIARRIIADPFAFLKFFWSDVKFYDKQWDIIDSVERNVKTFVPAGNKLGKDFVGAFIVLRWWMRAFLENKTCRILTTSVADEHMDVLWGEIGRFLATSEFPWNVEKGGPFAVNFQEIRRASEVKDKNPLSAVKGQVAKKGEKLAGRHADYTMLLGDEASGLEDQVDDQGNGWAKRFLYPGNCNEGCNNFFAKATDTDLYPDAGDVPAPDGTFYRKVIRITAEDSPNIRWAREQQAKGIEPDDETIVDGVLSWSEYQLRRATWNIKRQTVGLDAKFYHGAEVMLFPVEYLNRAEEIVVGERRRAEAGGCDPAEGGDRTSMVAVDRFGVIEVVSKKTPDTNVITFDALAFMRRHNIPPENFVFDRGGGGKQHADRLRAMDYPVRTVMFGESPTVELKRGMTTFGERKEAVEDRGAYKNRRAEMYGELADLLDPHLNPKGFALPRGECRKAEPGRKSLREQLQVVPREYDEGKLSIRSKSRKPGQEENKLKTLTELVSHSPDELDALVLACYGMLHRQVRQVAGAV